MLNHTVIVLLGGAVGAACRYWISVFVQARSESLFPLSTLIVNGIGSLAIGVIWQLLEHHDTATGLKLFLIVGLLGGFTTFSAFSMETFNLFRLGLLKLAVLNIIASNVICVSMAVAGYYISRWLN